MIQRTLQEKIASVLNGKKAVTIMGARQVGKSTLLNFIESMFFGANKIHFAKNDVKRQD